VNSINDERMHDDSRPAHDRWKRLPLSAVLTISLAGCYGLSEPSDHAGYTRDEAVVLTGYSLDPGRELVALAPGGVLLGGSIVAMRTVSGTEPAGTLDSGRPYYPWTMRGVVPSRAWATEREAGCDVSVTHLSIGEPSRLIWPSRTLTTTYLGPRLALTETQTTCLKAQLETGAALNDARAACSVGVSSLRVVASNRLVEDVVIDSADDIERLRCYDEIDGSLTVASDGSWAPDSAPGFEVALPRLRRVTGDVTLSYDMRPLPEGATPVHRCGVPTTRLVSRRIDLPALTHVDGTLTIQTPGRSFTSGEYIELGLDALRSVADVDMHFEVPPQPCGLNALPEVPVRLRIESSGDLTPGRFLGSLRSVGALEVVRGGIRYLLPNLQQAGSVSLDRVYHWDDALPRLRKVRGDFSVRESFLLGHGAPALSSVGGTLRVEESRYSSLSLGASSLTVGALSVTGNTFECVLQPDRSGGPCPDVSGVRLRVRSTGTLRIADNPALPASEVCALHALLVSRGLRGTIDLGGTSCP
jgi:hypothetical protein